MNLNRELTWRKSIIETALDKHLPKTDCPPEIIHRAMRYAVFNGGKRLRPILVLEGARLVGGEMEHVLPIACAVEFIHSYSLIHDDLPSMDDDDLRRGKPTCHKVFGEALAILAGDALLTRAFEIMGTTPSACPELTLRAWNELAIAAGSQGMIAGQVVDLDSEGKLVDGETLHYMHSHKTGALFKASIRIGAIISGANKSQLDILGNFADNFGLAFQITDDILDVEGTAHSAGKPAGSDARSQKATYASVFGLDKSRQMASDRVSMAVENLNVFGLEGDFLKHITLSLLGRDK